VDHRQVARIVAVTRVAIGAVLLAAPGAAGRRWLGEIARNPATKVALRGLGARDMAFGLGTLRALDRGEPVAGWVQLAAVGDLTDAAGGLLAARRLGAMRAVGTVASAGAAAALGFVLAGHVDEDVEPA
jgi:hypothetical protein